jgi:hypothetical protein
MKEIIIFFLVVSIIYMIKESFSFIQHISYIQKFPVQPMGGKSLKYEISQARQFGILFSIAYIITFIIV